MPGGLVAGVVGIVTADLWLVVVSWRRRAVLGGVAGALGIALVSLALVLGSSDGVVPAALVVALIFSIVGGVLCGLGRAFERLLDDEPDDEGRETTRN